MKKRYLVLISAIPAAVYAAGYAYQTINNTLNSISELKAQAKISKIHYQAFLAAASDEVVEQIKNDLQFHIMLNHEERKE